MELWRVGNVQSVQYEDRTYYRIEYTDELHYVTWWERNDNQMNEIEDKNFSSQLETIFCLKYAYLKHDPMKNLVTTLQTNT